MKHENSQVTLKSFTPELEYSQKQPYDVYMFAFLLKKIKALFIKRLPDFKQSWFQKSCIKNK